MRVAVIGAGPSGLVTLKYLLSACDSLGSDPVEPILFESESSVGGTFAHRTFEDGEVCLQDALITHRLTKCTVACRVPQRLLHTLWALGAHQTFDYRCLDPQKWEQGPYHYLSAARRSTDCRTRMRCRGHLYRTPRYSEYPKHQRRGPSIKSLSLVRVQG